ncbi:MAG TPA: S8 family serine peptidase [Steroidobacteraceae bacterium]|nr:S8 family serine peptidase [Steroidobacteraceae bacterium]
MRSFLVLLAAVAATMVAGGPAAAADRPQFKKPPSAEVAAKLRFKASEIAARNEVKTYIVQMAADPAIRYQGGVPGFRKSAAGKGEQYNARTPEAQSYAARLGQEQDRLLARVGAASGKIYSYRHVFNGFAARMTGWQADKLRSDKAVLRVWEDQHFALDTDNSPRFMGILDKKKGLRAKHGLRGEDVIIGVLDSGIVQEHPSLDPTGYGPPPAGWAGACEAGEGFAATDCNNKLIGARYYIDGFGAGNVVPEEFLSPRDSDGHGTHTATTAAGNENVTAVLAGKPVSVISGIAPRARIAVYKVCWQAPGAPSASCPFSDSAAATEQAILDGVDILTFSVGTAFSYVDPQDFAFLLATDAGIFVSRSAGNEGPGPETTAAGEPWVTTVAASTLSGPLFTLAAKVNSPASVAGNYGALESAISKSLQETGPITSDLALGEPVEACVALTNPGAVAGKIALLARGNCDFSVKLANAAAAGAIGVLMYTNANPKTVMGGTANAGSLSIPAVMIDNAPGLAIQAAITGGATVNVTLNAANFLKEKMKGNVMADFSSRGPYPNVSDWVKPDITAPGVNILAGATPEPNDGSFGGYFQYLSGTSMSTPHIAGLAALILEAHPDWSPAAVKSAIMTTARQNVVKEDGATPADPFDYGSGHANANKTIDPGIVYDAGTLDYLAASCGTDTPLVSSGDCGVLESFGYSLDPSDLNLPNIGIGALPGVQTVTRYVTNVGSKPSVYKVNFKNPGGYKLDIKPKKLNLKPGETKSYTVTITNRTAPPGEWRFGWLTWKDQRGHVARSQVVVRGSAVVAPKQIDATGDTGSTDFDVSFGYNGSYSADPHGFVAPFLAAFQVQDDPGNSFGFLDGPDEVLVDLFEPAAGATSLEFALFDAYNDAPDHDMDLYVFYCPDFFCEQVGFSATATSNERVKILAPKNDPAIDDPYVAIVHGSDTSGGAPATGIYFNWEVGPDTGTMLVTPSTNEAEIGVTGSVHVDWGGLFSGPAAKFVGDVSHSDATGIQDVTTIHVENDAGFGFCDLIACP